MISGKVVFLPGDSLWDKRFAFEETRLGKSRWKSLGRVKFWAIKDSTLLMAALKKTRVCF
jgi:hypothetical protein